MERLSAPERTREELRALMNGDLGTAAGRSDLVRLALRLIVEEALEGEVSDVLGRERYERGEGEKAGYRNGYRTGKVKTAEGAVEYSAPQVRDTPDSGDMRTEKEQRKSIAPRIGGLRGAKGRALGEERAEKLQVAAGRSNGQFRRIVGEQAAPAQFSHLREGARGAPSARAKVRAMAKTHRLPRLFRRKGKKRGGPRLAGCGARALARRRSARPA